MDVITQAEISRIALKYSLPVGLLQAMIAVESGGQAEAWRIEPAYRYLWDVSKNEPFRKLSSEEIADAKAPKDFPSKAGSKDTEWMGQRASWGVLQVMGAVARELGFSGHFPKLCGYLGVEYAAKHLQNYVERYYAKYGWDGVIAAYNAGSPRFDGHQFENQAYVNKVKRAWSK